MDMFALNYQQLMSLNPRLDCNNLRYDQPICVSGHANQPVFCNRKYYARPRDSCNSIMKFYGVSLSRLIRCNQRLNCNSYLAPGQVVLF